MQHFSYRPSVYGGSTVFSRRSAGWQLWNNYFVPEEYQDKFDDVVELARISGKMVGNNWFYFDMDDDMNFLGFV